MVNLQPEDRRELVEAFWAGDVKPPKLPLSSSTRAEMSGVQD